MFRLILYGCACLTAAVAPLTWVPNTAVPLGDAFPGWPEHFEGAALQPIPMDAVTESFAKHFPGRIASFTCGPKRLVVRWVATPTRKLHSAADCFRGSGFSIESASPGIDANGHAWGRFVARSDVAEDVRVSEQIVDANGSAWSDVSAWYWGAVWKKTKGPWWAFTVIERFEEGDRI
ncbi:MAG: hypothetical protein ACI9OU_001910 [Candidatus Promineifilaceae bacterium]|jgi:hypothetical protein